MLYRWIFQIARWICKCIRVLLKIWNGWIKGRFVCATESTWTFRVRKRELQFFVATNKFQISPDIIKVNTDVDFVHCPYYAELTVRRYSASLKQLPKHTQMRFVVQVMKLIDKLHTVCGIFHCDLHLGNIVIDLFTEEVRLIDFEDAVLLKHVKKLKQKVYGHKTKSLSLFTLCYLEQTEFLRQMTGAVVCL